MLSKEIVYSDKESSTDNTDGSPTKERSSSSERGKDRTYIANYALIYFKVVLFVAIMLKNVFLLAISQIKNEL